MTHRHGALVSQGRSRDKATLKLDESPRGATTRSFGAWTNRRMPTSLEGSLATTLAGATPVMEDHIDFRFIDDVMISEDRAPFVDEEAAAQTIHREEALHPLRQALQELELP